MRKSRTWGRRVPAVLYFPRCRVIKILSTIRPGVSLPLNPLSFATIAFAEFSAGRVLSVKSDKVLELTASGVA
jgi:hypothetical protein